MAKMQKSTAPMLGLYLIVFCLEAYASPESVSNLDQYENGEGTTRGRITVYYPNSKTQDILVEDLREVGARGSDDSYDKRGDQWASLHSGWGKRRQPQSWTALTNGWGKRPDPGWDRLSGMWGKREAMPSRWSKIGPMWGKRLYDDSNDDDGLQLGETDESKRAWTSLSGTWGKRDSPHWNNLRGMWGKRDAPQQTPSSAASSPSYKPLAHPM